MTVGMIMGTGVLSLPRAVAGLGYVVGVTLCFCFGIYAGYLGIILGEARTRFFPTATGFAQLGSRCVGAKFGNFTKYVMWCNWYSVLPLYMLTAIESLRSAFYWTDVCYYVWGLFVCGVMILPVQMRSFDAISGVVAVSDASVIVVIISILVALGTEGQDTPDGFEHSIGVPKEKFFTAYNSVSAMIFAYQGQSVFLEIMSEMKTAEDWPKALWFGQSIMIPCYVVTAATGYYLLGDTVPGFLPSALPNNGVKTFVNLLLCFHVIIAYLIHNQPLTQGIEAQMDPTKRASNVRHFWLSTSILFSSYVVANLIPFFSELVAILGAAFGSPILFAYPTTFYLRGMKSRGLPVPRKHMILCSFALYVLFPLTFILGIISAFVTLAEKSLALTENPTLIMLNHIHVAKILSVCGLYSE